MRGSNQTIEAVPSLGNASIYFLWLAPGLVALAVFLATLLTLDPAGDRPSLPEGPGLTTDEVLNVEAGLVLWRDLRSYGWGLLDPNSWYDVYSAPGYQSDYPPLGRLILAVGHDFMEVVWPVPADPALPPRPYSTIHARAASALAFALTVLLVGGYASRWYGTRAGLCAALALPLMPRLFAHAHIASIETLVGLFFTWTVLETAHRWPREFAEWAASPRTRSRWSIPWKAVVVTGLLLGLTFLTKIQAVLFPIPFAIWAVWNFGRRGISAVAAVGVISAVVFFVGWPWLWIAPLEHAKEYFAPADRAHLNCWYVGQKFLDSEVPWHYSFAMFAVTVPVGLHILGLGGVIVGGLAPQDQSRAERKTTVGVSPRPIRDPRLQLLLAATLFPLVLFAVPGIPVYDGERLFLVSFPLWAVCMGRGAACLMCRREGEAPAEPLPRTSVNWRVWLSRSFALPVVLLLCSESYTLCSLNPCHLSYYSWLVGGLRGANALGFERTYWADSITRTLHQQIVLRVPSGSTVHVAPVLHPLQLAGMALQSPLLQRHQIDLAAYDDSVRSQVKYVLIYRRLADPRESLNEPVQPGQLAPPGMRLLTEIRSEGVQLAVLYETL